MKLILGVDPATSCGLCLIDGESKELVESYTIKAKGSTWGEKLNDFGDQFEAVFAEHFEDIAHIVYEKNGRFASDLITLFVGRIAQALPGIKIGEKAHGVGCQTWKKWVRLECGINIKDPKGCESLAMVRPGWEEDMGDDEADAAMIALCWLSKRKNI